MLLIRLLLLTPFYSICYHTIYYTSLDRYTITPATSPGSENFDLQINVRRMPWTSPNIEPVTLVFNFPLSPDVVDFLTSPSYQIQGPAGCTVTSSGPPPLRIGCTDTAETEPYTTWKIMISGVKRKLMNSPSPHIGQTLATLDVLFNSVPFGDQTIPPALPTPTPMFAHWMFDSPPITSPLFPAASSVTSDIKITDVFEHGLTLLRVTVPLGLSLSSATLASTNVPVLSEREAVADITETCIPDCILRLTYMVTSEIYRTPPSDRFITLAKCVNSLASHVTCGPGYYLPLRHVELNPLSINSVTFDTGSPILNTRILVISTRYNPLYNSADPLDAIGIVLPHGLTLTAPQITTTAGGPDFTEVVTSTYYDQTSRLYLFYRASFPGKPWLIYPDFTIRACCLHDADLMLTPDNYRGLPVRVFLAAASSTVATGASPLTTDSFIPFTANPRPPVIPHSDVLVHITEADARLLIEGPQTALLSNTAYAELTFAWPVTLPVGASILCGLEPPFVDSGNPGFYEYSLGMANGRYEMQFSPDGLMFMLTFLNAEPAGHVDVRLSFIGGQVGLVPVPMTLLCSLGDKLRGSYTFLPTKYYNSDPNEQPSVTIYKMPYDQAVDAFLHIKLPLALVPTRSDLTKISILINTDQSEDYGYSNPFSYAAEMAAASTTPDFDTPTQVDCFTAERGVECVFPVTFYTDGTPYSMYLRLPQIVAYRPFPISAALVRGRSYPTYATRYDARMEYSVWSVVGVPYPEYVAGDPAYSNNARVGRRANLIDSPTTTHSFTMTVTCTSRYDACTTTMSIPNPFERLCPWFGPGTESSAILYINAPPALSEACVRAGRFENTIDYQPVCGDFETAGSTVTGQYVALSINPESNNRGGTMGIRMGSLSSLCRDWKTNGAPSSLDFTGLLRKGVDAKDIPSGGLVVTAVAGELVGENDPVWQFNNGRIEIPSFPESLGTTSFGTLTINGFGSIYTKPSMIQVTITPRDTIVLFGGDQIRVELGNVCRWMGKDIHRFSVSGISTLVSVLHDSSDMEAGIMYIVFLEPTSIQPFLRLEIHDMFCVESTATYRAQLVDRNFRPIFDEYTPSETLLSFSPPSITLPVGYIWVPPTSELVPNPNYSTLTSPYLRSTNSNGRCLIGGSCQVRFSITTTLHIAHGTVFSLDAPLQGCQLIWPIVEVTVVNADSPYSLKLSTNVAHPNYQPFLPEKTTLVYQCTLNPVPASPPPSADIKFTINHAPLTGGTTYTSSFDGVIQVTSSVPDGQSMVDPTVEPTGEIFTLSGYSGMAGTKFNATCHVTFPDPVINTFSLRISIPHYFVPAVESVGLSIDFTATNPTGFVFPTQPPGAKWSSGGSHLELAWDIETQSTIEAGRTFEVTLGGLVVYEFSSVYDATSGKIPSWYMKLSDYTPIRHDVPLVTPDQYRVITFPEHSDSYIGHHGYRALISTTVDPLREGVTHFGLQIGIRLPDEVTPLPGDLLQLELPHGVLPYSEMSVVHESELHASILSTTCGNVCGIFFAACRWCTVAEHGSDHTPYNPGLDFMMRTVRSQRYSPKAAMGAIDTYVICCPVTGGISNQGELRIHNLAHTGTSTGAAKRITYLRSTDGGAHYDVLAMGITPSHGVILPGPPAVKSISFGLPISVTSKQLNSITAGHILAADNTVILAEGPRYLVDNHSPYIGYELDRLNSYRNNLFDFHSERASIEEIPHPPNASISITNIASSPDSVFLYLLSSPNLIHCRALRGLFVATDPCGKPQIALSEGLMQPLAPHLPLAIPKAFECLGAGSDAPMCYVMAGHMLFLFSRNAGTGGLALISTQLLPSQAATVTQRTAANGIVAVTRQNGNRGMIAGVMGDGTGFVFKKTPESTHLVLNAPNFLIPDVSPECPVADVIFAESTNYPIAHSGSPSLLVLLKGCGIYEVPLNDPSRTPKKLHLRSRRPYRLIEPLRPDYPDDLVPDDRLLKTAVRLSPTPQGTSFCLFGAHDLRPIVVDRTPYGLSHHGIPSPSEMPAAPLFGVEYSPDLTTVIHWSHEMLSAVYNAVPLRISYHPSDHKYPPMKGDLPSGQAWKRLAIILPYKVPFGSMIHIPVPTVDLNELTIPSNVYITIIGDSFSVPTQVAQASGSPGGKYYTESLSVSLNFNAGAKEKIAGQYPVNVELQGHTQLPVFPISTVDNANILLATSAPYASLIVDNDPVAVGRLYRSASTGRGVAEVIRRFELVEDAQPDALGVGSGISTSSLATLRMAVYIPIDQSITSINNPRFILYDIWPTSDSLPSIQQINANIYSNPFSAISVQTEPFNCHLYDTANSLGPSRQLLCIVANPSFALPHNVLIEFIVPVGRPRSDYMVNRGNPDYFFQYPVLVIETGSETIPNCLYCTTVISGVYIHPLIPVLPKLGPLQPPFMNSDDRYPLDTWAFPATLVPHDLNGFCIVSYSMEQLCLPDETQGPASPDFTRVPPAGGSPLTRQHWYNDRLRQIDAFIASPFRGISYLASYQNIYVFHPSAPLGVVPRYGSEARLQETDTSLREAIGDATITALAIDHSQYVYGNTLFVGLSTSQLAVVQLDPQTGHPNLPDHGPVYVSAPFTPLNPDDDVITKENRRVIAIYLREVAPFSTTSTIHVYTVLRGGTVVVYSAVYSMPFHPPRGYTSSSSVTLTFLGGYSSLLPTPITAIDKRMSARGLVHAASQGRIHTLRFDGANVYLNGGGSYTPVAVYEDITSLATNVQENVVVAGTKRGRVFTATRTFTQGQEGPLSIMASILYDKRYISQSDADRTYTILGASSITFPNEITGLMFSRRGDTLHALVGDTIRSFRLLPKATEVTVEHIPLTQPDHPEGSRRVTFSVRASGWVVQPGVTTPQILRIRLDVPPWLDFSHANQAGDWHLPPDLISCISYSIDEVTITTSGTIDFVLSAFNDVNVIAPFDIKLVTDRAYTVNSIGHPQQLDLSAIIYTGPDAGPLLLGGSDAVRHQSIMPKALVAVAPLRLATQDNKVHAGINDPIPVTITVDPAPIEHGYAFVFSPDTTLCGFYSTEHQALLDYTRSRTIVVQLLSSVNDGIATVYFKCTEPTTVTITAVPVYPSTAPNAQYSSSHEVVIHPTVQATMLSPWFNPSSKQLVSGVAVPITFALTPGSSPHPVVTTFYVNYLDIGGSAMCGIRGLEMEPIYAPAFPITIPATKTAPDDAAGQTPESNPHPYHMFIYCEAAPAISSPLSLYTAYTPPETHGIEIRSYVTILTHTATTSFGMSSPFLDALSPPKEPEPFPIPFREEYSLHLATSAIVPAGFNATIKLEGPAYPDGATPYCMFRSLDDPDSNAWYPEITVPYEAPEGGIAWIRFHLLCTAIFPTSAGYKIQLTPNTHAIRSFALPVLSGKSADATIYVPGGTTSDDVPSSLNARVIRGVWNPVVLGVQGSQPITDVAVFKVSVLPAGLSLGCKVATSPTDETVGADEVTVEWNLGESTSGQAYGKLWIKCSSNTQSQLYPHVLTASSVGGVPLFFPEGGLMYVGVQIVDSATLVRSEEVFVPPIVSPDRIVRTLPFNTLHHFSVVATPQGTAATYTVSIPSNPSCTFTSSLQPTPSSSVSVTILANQEHSSPFSIHCTSTVDVSDQRIQIASSVFMTPSTLFIRYFGAFTASFKDIGPSLEASQTYPDIPAYTTSLVLSVLLQPLLTMPSVTLPVGHYIDLRALFDPFPSSYQLMTYWNPEIPELYPCTSFLANTPPSPGGQGATLDLPTGSSSTPAGTAYIYCQRPGPIYMNVGLSPSNAERKLYEVVHVTAVARPTISMVDEYGTPISLNASSTFYVWQLYRVRVTYPGHITGMVTIVGLPSVQGCEVGIYPADNEHLDRIIFGPSSASAINGVRPTDDFAIRCSRANAVDGMSFTITSTASYTESLTFSRPTKMRLQLSIGHPIEGIYLYSSLTGDLPRSIEGVLPPGYAHTYDPDRFFHPADSLQPFTYSLLLLPASPTQYSVRVTFVGTTRCNFVPNLLEPNTEVSSITITIAPGEIRAIFGVTCRAALQGLQFLVEPFAGEPSMDPIVTNPIVTRGQITLPNFPSEVTAKVPYDLTLTLSPPPDSPVQILIMDVTSGVPCSFKQPQDADYTLSSLYITVFADQQSTSIQMMCDLDSTSQAHYISASAPAPEAFLVRYGETTQSAPFLVVGRVAIYTNSTKTLLTAEPFLFTDRSSLFMVTLEPLPPVPTQVTLSLDNSIANCALNVFPFSPESPGAATAVVSFETHQADSWVYIRCTRSAFPANGPSINAAVTSPLGSPYKPANIPRLAVGSFIVAQTPTINFHTSPISLIQGVPTRFSIHFSPAHIVTTTLRLSFTSLWGRCVLYNDNGGVLDPSSSAETMLVTIVHTEASVFLWIRCTLEHLEPPISTLHIVTEGGGYAWPYYSQPVDIISVVCPDVTLPPFGSQVIYRDGGYGDRSYLATVEYVCQAGYVVQGNALRTCGADGWSGTNPTCELYQCPTLPLPGPNALPVQYTNGVHGNERGIGANATYSCTSEYELARNPLSPRSYRVCTETGWDEHAPTCEPKNCGSLDLPDGSVAYTAGPNGARRLGSEAHHQCSPGFELISGDTIRTCTGAGWSGVAPTCFGRACAALTVPLNARPITYSDGSQGENIKTGDTATYTCEDGYLLIGTASRTCSADGWLGTAPRCSPRVCGPLPFYPSAIVSIINPRGHGEEEFGANATQGCSTGFDLLPTASPWRVCNEMGQWSGTAGDCTPHDCGADPLGNNTASAIISNGIYGPRRYTSTATVQCKTGFIPDGESVSQCSAQGWAPANLTCKPRQCPPLTNPAYTLAYEDMGYGQLGYQARAHFTCEDGLYPYYANSSVHPGFRTCGDQGEWLDVNPVCRPFDCGHASVPQWGLVSYTNNGNGDTSSGSTVTYSCLPGFTLSADLPSHPDIHPGDKIHTCRIGGWDGKVPSCIDQDECVANPCNTYSTHSKCINTLGSFICTPFIIGNSLSVPSASGILTSDRNVELTGVKGSLRLDFSYFKGLGTIDPGISAVNFYNPYYPEPTTLWTQDVGIVFVGQSLNTSETGSVLGSIPIMRATTYVPPGQGQNLFLQLRFCYRLSPENAIGCNVTRILADDTLINYGYRVSYPIPIISPASLFSITYNTDPAPAYVGMDKQGELMALTITHLYLDMPSHTALYYGEVSTRYKHWIPIDFDHSISRNVGGFPAVLVFKMPDDLKEADGVFTLVMLNQTHVTSTDTYSYPQEPFIEVVSGCSGFDPNTNSTFDCPTAGDVTLTVAGTGFLAPLSFFVNGRLCPLIHRSNTRFNCTLPPGTGSGLSVLIKAGSQRLDSRARISYARPTVLGVVGCSHTEHPSVPLVTNCSRSGGDVITVVGRNFYHEGAQVRIGGIDCTEVTHHANTPHEVLYCKTPGGITVMQPVDVFQRYGELSADPVALSYTQCQPGYHDSELACVECPLGEYSDEPSQPVCKSCPPGTFADTPGRTRCRSCDAGKYSSSNATACADCPRGHFSLSGAPSCTPCSPGTHAPNEGMRLCEPCMLGGENTADFTNCQCKAGYYMSANRECIACMDGGNCTLPGTSVFNVRALSGYFPSITRYPYDHVSQVRIPLQSRIGHEEDRRVLRQKITKALFDGTAFPMSRVTIVSLTNSRITWTPKNNNTNSTDTTPASQSVKGKQYSLLADDTVSVDGVEAIIEIVPSPNDSPALTLAAQVANHFSATNQGQGAASLSDVLITDVPIVATRTDRYPVNSFQVCLNDACLDGGICDAGHTGNMCTTCEYGYGKSSIFKCTKCADGALRWLILIGGVCAAVIVCGIMSWKQIVDGASVTSDIAAPAVPIILKVVISGIQVMAIAARYDLRWPGILGPLFATADTTAGLGVTVVTLDCFLPADVTISPFWITSIAFLLLPFIALFIPTVVIGIMYFCARYKAKREAIADDEEWKQFCEDIVREYRLHKVTHVNEQAKKAAQLKEDAKPRLLKNYWDEKAEAERLEKLKQRRPAVREAPVEKKSKKQLKKEALEAAIREMKELEERAKAASVPPPPRKLLPGRISTSDGIFLTANEIEQRAQAIRKANTEKQQAEEAARRRRGQSSRLKASKPEEDPNGTAEGGLQSPSTSTPPLSTKDANGHSSHTNGNGTHRGIQPLPPPPKPPGPVPPPLPSSSASSSAPVDDSKDVTIVKNSQGLKLAFFNKRSSGVGSALGANQGHDPNHTDKYNTSNKSDMADSNNNNNATSSRSGGQGSGQGHSAQSSSSTASSSSSSSSSSSTSPTSPLSHTSPAETAPILGKGVELSLPVDGDDDEGTSSSSSSSSAFNSPVSPRTADSTDRSPVRLYGLRLATTPRGFDESQYDGNELLRVTSADQDVLSNMNEEGLAIRDQSQGSSSQSMGHRQIHDHGNGINGSSSSSTTGRRYGGDMKNEYSDDDNDDDDGDSDRYHNDQSGESGSKGKKPKKQVRIAPNALPDLEPVQGAEVEETQYKLGWTKRRASVDAAIEAAKDKPPILPPISLHSQMSLRRLVTSDASDEEMLQAESHREMVARKERHDLAPILARKHRDIIQKHEDAEEAANEYAAEKKKLEENLKVTASEMRKNLESKRFTRSRLGKVHMGYLITTFTVILFLIHPNLTRQFFLMLSCKQIGETDDDNFMLGDMSKECYGSEHLFFSLLVGLPMLFLWVVGIPLYAFFVLYTNSTLITMLPNEGNEIDRREKKDFEAQAGFLYRAYHPTRYYWFLFDMLRKVLLVAIAVFFPGALHTQLLLACLLLFLSIVVQVAFKPFENKFADNVEFMSLFCSFMVFFLANFLFVDISEGSKEVITVTILIVGVVFVIFAVYAMIHALKEEREFIAPLRKKLAAAVNRGENVYEALERFKLELERRKRGEALKAYAHKHPSHRRNDAHLLKLDLEGKQRSEMEQIFDIEVVKEQGRDVFIKGDTGTVANEMGDGRIYDEKLISQFEMYEDSSTDSSDREEFEEDDIEIDPEDAKRYQAELGYIEDGEDEDGQGDGDAEGGEGENGEGKQRAGGRGHSDYQDGDGEEEDREYSDDPNEMRLTSVSPGGLSTSGTRKPRKSFIPKRPLSELTEEEKAERLARRARVREHYRRKMIEAVLPSVVMPEFDNEVTPEDDQESKSGERDDVSVSSKKRSTSRQKGRAKKTSEGDSDKARSSRDDGDDEDDESSDAPDIGDYLEGRTKVSERVDNARRVRESMLGGKEALEQFMVEQKLAEERERQLALEAERAKKKKKGIF